jgi:hypothetical protein
MESMSNTPWRKSSYSGGNGGECVEVADAANAVLVRDTTDREGCTLSVPAGAWKAFTATLR